MSNFFKDKRIFVSGGAGVIGKELVKKLCDQEAIIFVGDREEMPSEWKSQTIHYKKGDLNYIREELLEFEPEIFIHLAATFERSEESKKFWYENYWDNIQLSHHLMHVLKDCPTLKKVVFASSYLIYNPSLYLCEVPTNALITMISTDFGKITEDDTIKPRNLCGFSKLMHEGELEYLSKFYQFEAISARIFRVYGKGSRDIISRWVRSILNKEVITVHNVENSFDYVYAGEVAEALLKIAEFGKSNIYNVGSGRSRKIQDVLNVLHKCFPNKVNEYKVEGQDVFESSQACISKLENDTGFTSKIPLEIGIPKIIEFERGKL